MVKLFRVHIACKCTGVTGASVWVSEGDVLFDWGCHIVSLAQGNKPRPINAHNTINLCGRLPQTTPPSSTGGAFAANIVTGSFRPVSPAEARGHVGPLAAKYHAALTRQSTPDQLRKVLRFVRGFLDAGKDASVVCGAPATGELFNLTNRSKADFARLVDFSPVVVAVGDIGGEKRKSLGKIVYFAFATSCAVDNGEDCAWCGGKGYRRKSVAGGNF